MQSYPTQSPGLFEQIIMIVFTLMIFVTIASGRADTVLKAFVDIVSHLLTVVLSVLGSLFMALAKLVATLIGNAIKAIVSAVRSQSSESRSIGNPNRYR